MAVTGRGIVITKAATETSRGLSAVARASRSTWSSSAVQSGTPDRALSRPVHISGGYRDFHHDTCDYAHAVRAAEDKAGDVWDQLMDDSDDE